MTKEDFFIILKWTIWGSLFLVLITPLIVSSGQYFPGTVFPFIVGKNIFFRTLISIAALAWFILAIYVPQYRPKKSILLGSVAFFIGVLALANIFGENSLKSFFGNFERMEGFITLVYISLYLLIAGTMFYTEKIWNAFFTTSLGISTLLGVYAIVQENTTNPIVQSSRVDATFGNPSYLAAYLVVHIFIALWFLIRTLSHKKVSWQSTWLWFIPVILIQGTALVKTAARGAWVGLAAGLFVFTVLLILIERKSHTVRLIASSVLAVCILCVGLFITFREHPFIQQNFFLSRFAHISLSDDTTKSRFIIWGMAYRGFLERPVLGWGQENFGYVFNKYHNPQMSDREPWFDRAHNIFFDLLISGGALALLGYVGIIGSLGVVLWKKTNLSNLEKISLTALFVGYCIQNMFLFDTITSLILFFSISAYIYYRSTISDAKKGIMLDSYKKYGLILVGILAILFLFYISVYIPLRSAMLLRQAVQVPISSLSKKLDLFKSVIALGGTGLAEAREQLVLSAFDIKSSTVTTEDQQQYLLYVEEQVRALVADTPTDVRVHILAGGFFQQRGQYDTAEPYLYIAKMLAPTKQQTIIAWAINIFKQNNRAEAQVEITRAYNLNPNNLDVQKVYAAIMATSTKTSDVNTAMVLSQQDQYNMLITQLKNESKLNGETVKTLRSLGLAYWAEGAQEQAIAAFERARLQATTDTQRSEIDLYIQQIKAGKKLKFK